MRQKDFDEVATLLGNELRTCDANEADGIGAAIGFLMGHAAHRYPDLDVERIRERFNHATRHGWDPINEDEPRTLPEVQVSATGACLCTSFKWNTWNGQCSACGHEAHGSRIHCGALA